MATRTRPRPQRKAVTKRRASRRGGRRQGRLGRWARARLKRWVTSTRKAREAKRKAEAARHVTRAGSVAITTAPSRVTAWWASAVAYWRANNLVDQADGRATDAADRANRADRRRGQRHSTFLCYGHVGDPLRFATAAELNAHLAEGHPEPERHARGSASKPVRNITKGPTRPPRRRTTTSTPRKRRSSSGPRGTAAATSLAGDTVATLDEIGSQRIRSVSQIKDIAASIEKIALQFEEAITGFQQNGRTSEEAPIDAGVLAQLDPAKSAAEAIAAAAVAFVSAFDDYYSQDVREAQEGERMSNDALTS